MSPWPRGGGGAGSSPRPASALPAKMAASGVKSWKRAWSQQNVCSFVRGPGAFKPPVRVWATSPPQTPCGRAPVAGGGRGEPPFWTAFVHWAQRAGAACGDRKLSPFAPSRQIRRRARLLARPRPGCQLRGAGHLLKSPARTGVA